MKHLIILLRPQQWIKNAFIFLPLFFSGNFMNLPLLFKTLVAFLAYSFAASSIYCFNDIWDVNSDKLHPSKCKRPIASGAVSITRGYILMILMIILSCLIIFSLNCYIEGLVIIGYWILNIEYCLLY